MSNNEIPQSRALLRLIRGSGLLFLSRLSGAAIAYLTQILLARWMGAHQLGTYVLAFAWCLILANVAVMGFPTASVRFIGMNLARQRPARIRGFIRRSRQIVLVLGLLVATLAALYTLLSPQGGQLDQNTTTFLIAYASVPLLTVIRLHGGLAHGFSWFALFALPHGVLRPLLLLTATALVWFLGYPLSAATVMTLHLCVIGAVALGQTVALSWRMRRRLPTCSPEFETRRWVGTAMPLCLTSMFTAYFPELNMILVGLFLPESDLAIYNAAFRTALFIGFGLTAVDNLILPRLARLWETRNLCRLQHTLSHATVLKFGAASVAVAGIFWLGEDILGLFGPDFRRGADTLRIVALAYLIRAAIGPAAELLSVTGQQQRCLVVFGVSFALLAVCCRVLIPRYGLPGAALAFLAVTLVSGLWLYLLVVRHHRVYPSIIHAFRH